MSHINMKRLPLLTAAALLVSASMISSSAWADCTALEQAANHGRCLSADGGGGGSGGSSGGSGGSQGGGAGGGDSVRDIVNSVVGGADLPEATINKIIADYNAHQDAAEAYKTAYDAMYKLQLDSASRTQAFGADGNPNYRLQFVVPHPDGSGYDLVTKYTANASAHGGVSETRRTYGYSDTHRSATSRDGSSSSMPAKQGAGSITITDKKTGKTTTATPTLINANGVAVTAGPHTAGHDKRAAIKADPALAAKARADALAMAAATSAPHTPHPTSTPPKVSLGAVAPKPQAPAVTQAPRPAL